jgi:Lrp/AsnC family leucine-responsive transcriptional regulator
MIDETDRRILAILQEDARTPNAEIARRVGMAPSAIFERVRKLEERGVVLGYEARLNPAAFGLGLVAFVFVRLEGGAADEVVERRLAEMPEVQEVHHIAGEDCFLVKVRVADAEALRRWLREGIGGIPGVHSTRTTIVLGTVKETGKLALTGEEARV